MKHMASSQQSEVKAWEEQLEACEHTLLLNQEEVGPDFQGEYMLHLHPEALMKTTSAYPVPFSLAALQTLRPHFEPLVMFDLRRRQLWETTIRWNRRERTRFGAFQIHRTWSGCQVGYNHSGGRRR
jgi:hypothetical protein